MGLKNTVQTKPGAEQGKDIFTFTQNQPRKSFQQQALGQMRIRGKNVTGTASLVSDLPRIKHMAQTESAANGRDMSRRMGFWVGHLGTANPNAVRQAAGSTYFIEIKAQDEK